MTTPTARASAALAAGPGRHAEVDVDGFAMSCEVPTGDGPTTAAPTAFGLLAASLSACTAMSARTFLERWQIEPSAVEVDVAMSSGPTTELSAT